MEESSNGKSEKNSLEFDEINREKKYSGT